MIPGDKNLYSTYLKIARDFVKRFERKKGVIGAALIGGSGRGNVDKYSDIDIAIFVKRGTDLGMKKEGETFVKLSGNRKVKIDWGIAEYESELKGTWSMEKRWAYSQCKIIYDPEGKVKRLIDKKLIFPEKEREWLLMEGVEQAHYWGIAVPEKLAYRGDMISAHYSINLGLAMLLQTLFALNKQFIPSPHWRIWFARKLKWKPKDFDEKIREIILVKEFTLEELKRRQKALLYLWKRIKPKVEKEVGEKWEEFRKTV